MTKTELRIGGKVVDVRAGVSEVPEKLVSGSAESRAIMTRVGLVVLGRIKAAFIVKARGGTDEGGVSWAPLSPKTIAYSRTRGRGGRTSAEKKRFEFPSQALTAKQQDRWWDVYHKYLGRFRGDKSHAAAAAWLVLKSEGATTLVTKYGYRKVEILRDTGLLFNSLSPGYRGTEQVFRTGPGEVVVGTNRKGAKAHHEGVPGRLPQRRLWPEPSKWPQSWWDDITDQVRQGILDIVTKAVRSAR